MILSKCGVVLVAVVHLVSILDAINGSTTNSTMDNSNSTLVIERVIEPDEIARLWKSCPTMDLNMMPASLSLECKRRKCVSFIEEACSCLSIRCPQHIYHHENASALCSSHLKTNCSKPAVNEEGYFSEEYCLKSLLCLDCEGNTSFCQEICEDPLQTKFGADNYCSDEIEFQREESFCAEYISSRNCSNLILSDINCTNSPENCASICRRTQPLGFLARGCPSEVYQFCVHYSMILLNTSHILTEETLLFYIDVMNTYYRVFPGSVVTDLLDPLLSQLAESSLLVNNSNLKLILKVFNVLFDDIEDICNISSSLYSNIHCQSDFVTESAVLLISQLETLGKVVSMDITEGRRNSSFTFIGDSLVISVTSVSNIGATDNQYRIIIEGDQSIRGNTVNNFPLDGFLAEIVISEDVFCKNNENYTMSGCSGVVAVSVVNRELLQRPSVNFSYQVDQFDSSTVKHSLSDLMSIQVFGVQDLSNKLIVNPIEFTLRISNYHNDFSLDCFYWNHTQRLWSTEGVTSEQSSNGTMKCTSIHLTSFAAFETNFSIYHDIALIFIYISCGTSIVFLLATIFCIPFFLKTEMFQKVHFFIHFNLALVALLAYLILVIAVDGTGLDKHGCRFLAVGLHYFFLAAFSWMLCEGIILYLMLVVVFSKLSKKWWFFMIIGYGLPAIPVIVTLSVHQSDYFAYDTCWLSSDNGVGFSFIVPAVLTILVNVIVFFIVLWKVYKSVKKYKRGSDQANIRLLVKLLVATLVLAPLLGITAISAVLHATGGTFTEISDTAADIFTWMFIICNFLQGFSMFFFHVVRSDQLWETSRGKVVKAFFIKCLPKRSAKATRASQLKGSSLSAIASNEGNTNISLVEHNPDSAVVLELRHPNNLVSEDTQIDGRADSDSPRYVTNPAAVLGSTLLESSTPTEDRVQGMSDDERSPGNEQFSR